MEIRAEFVSLALGGIDAPGAEATMVGHVCIFDVLIG